MRQHKVTEMEMKTPKKGKHKAKDKPKTKKKAKKGAKPFGGAMFGGGPY